MATILLVILSSANFNAEGGFWKVKGHRLFLGLPLRISENTELGMCEVFPLLYSRYRQDLKNSLGLLPVARSGEVSDWSMVYSSGVSLRVILTDDIVISLLWFSWRSWWRSV